MNAFTRTATACTITAAALLSASPASAAECTPAAAWAEQVEVTPAVPAHTITIPGADAVGEPTIQVEVANPDYVAPTYTPGYWAHIPATYTPGKGEKSIPNPDYVPAWDEPVDGTDDQTVVDGYEKFTWHNPYAEPTTPPPGSYWKSSGITQDAKGATPDTILHQGNGNGSWFYYRTVSHILPGTPASTVHHDAVGEPTIPNPAYVPPVYVAAHDEWVKPVYTPAVGEKTITVTRDNPDYIPAVPATTVDVAAVPAVTDTVHHDAVTCPAEPTTPNEPTEPTTPEKPTTPAVPAAPAAPAHVTPATRRASVVVVPAVELAHTGSEVPWLLGAAGVLLAGVGACTISIGATRRNRGGVK